MFEAAAAFNTDISKWQTGNVIDMSHSTPSSVPYFVDVDGVTDLFFDFF